VGQLTPMITTFLISEDDILKMLKFEKSRINGRRAAAVKKSMLYDRGCEMV
jgi:hypothetical protein